MESVTSLLQLLNKPGLIYWSNKIGLEGTRLKDYRKKSTCDGISRHKQVEDYLLKGIKFEYSDKVDEMIRGYKIIGVEIVLEDDGICGRADLIIEKDGIRTVCDFKSGTKIYLEQKIQISAYNEMSGSHEMAIINFDTWEIKTLNIDSFAYYTILRNLFKIKQTLNSLNEKI